MKFKVLTVDETQTSTGKPMYRVNIADETGNQTKLNMFDKVEVDQQLEGEIYENEKGYKNFRNAHKPESKRPNMDRIMDKKNGMIEVAQDRKAQNIKEAQDRSAWMWAKNNAAELMRLVPVPFEDDPKMVDRLHSLATKIYNLEPIEPF